MFPFSAASDLYYRAAFSYSCISLYSLDFRKRDMWILKRNPERFLVLKPDRVCGCGCPGPFRRVPRLSPPFLLPRLLSVPDPGGDACVCVSKTSLCKPFAAVSRHMRLHAHLNWTTWLANSLCNRAFCPRRRLQ